jgi:hypothetical protein
MRRRCAKRLRELNVPVPVPFTAEAYCANLAVARGRPIHLLPKDTSGATVPCGLWLSTTTADYVVFDRTAPPVLRDHIILHELSHILCGHRGALRADNAHTLFELLDPDVVRLVLGRTSAYEVAEEREAEELASMIGERASPRPRALREPSDADVAAVIGRFSAALAADRNWRA